MAVMRRILFADCITGTEPEVRVQMMDVGSSTLHRQSAKAPYKIDHREDGKDKAVHVNYRAWASDRYALATGGGMNESRLR